MDLFNTLTPTTFTSLWNKYRPAIVHLMMATGEGPQQYKLYSHEFKALAAKERNFTFVLQAFQGKATNNIKSSIAAQDLLTMLNLSRKGSEQIQKHQFLFKLDNHFVLHIERMQPETEQ